MALHDHGAAREERRLHAYRAGIRRGVALARGDHARRVHVERRHVVLEIDARVGRAVGAVVREHRGVHRVVPHREHRALGHRTILITGALDFAVEGLRPLFDEIVSAKLTTRPDGTYSGHLAGVPPTGEMRAQILADYCASEGLLLEESIAYADSTSDLPLLEAVGFPVAVNPETRLAAVARKRGWLVEHWSTASGAPSPSRGPIGGIRERTETAPLAERC